MRIPVMLAVIAALGCAEGVGSSQIGAPPAPVTPSEWGGLPGDTMIPADLSYREQAVGGARLDERLPMLIALHGKQGSPEGIIRALSGLHTPARLIAPRGVAFGSGFVWWDLARKDNDARAFSRAAAEASRRVAGFVRQLAKQKPTLGRPVFVGFSQGAIVTYTLAAREPGLTSSAFPLSGLLPLGLEPSSWPAGAPKPMVHAFHGGQDSLVPLALDRDSVERLRAAGVPVTLTELPDMPHVMGPGELSRLLPELDDALRREASADAANASTP